MPAASLPAMMVRWAMGSCVVQLAVAAQTGKLGCPCINPWAGGAHSDLTYVQGGQKCLGYRPKPAAEKLCYPVDYGAEQCLNWDLALPPNCATEDRSVIPSAPDYCADVWCFVNPSNCNLSANPSSHFPGTNLSYSYETCGTVDSYSQALLLHQLRDRVIRVGRSDALKWWPEYFKNPQGEWTGWTVDFLNQLAEKGGFTIEYVEISSESMLLSENAFDACVRDVALKNVHTCVGAYTENRHRLSLTTFSPTYTPVNIYLVATAKPDENLLTSLSKAFKPFSTGLWVAITVVALFIGFAMYAVGEVEVEEPNFVLHVLKGSIGGFRVAVLQLFGQGSFEVSTRAGKLIIVGFGFMCLIAGASYTANLASFLLVKNLKTDITGLEGAIAQNVKVCISSNAWQQPLLRRYDGLEPLFVKCPNPAKCLTYMDEGKCGVMLIDEFLLEQIAPGVGTFKDIGPRCRITKVGDPVLAIQYGAPVGRDILQPISSLWVEARNFGAVTEMINKYPVRASNCPTLTGVNDFASPLVPADILGVLLITVCCCVAGLAVHCKQKLAIKKKLGNISREAPPDIEGEAPEAADLPREKESEIGLLQEMAHVRSEMTELRSQMISEMTEVRSEMTNLSECMRVSGGMPNSTTV